MSHRGTAIALDQWKPENTGDSHVVKSNRIASLCHLGIGLVGSSHTTELYRDSVVKNMVNKIPFNSLLVPTDFSENAWSAFQHARLLVDDLESEIVVMYAIDPAIVEQIVQLGIGDHEEIVKAMRKSSLERLKRYGDVSTDSTKVDTLVCEGEPFFEIIRKAEEFAVGASVRIKLGHRDAGKSLLFGSTAEKVIRGSKKPVIVLPTE